jgi:hypothetical protein
VTPTGQQNPQGPLKLLGLRGKTGKNINFFFVILLKKTDFVDAHFVASCGRGVPRGPARELIEDLFLRPQQMDLWVRVLHVCVGTAACPWTADFRPCAPQAKIYRFVPFYLKKKRFL